MELSPSVNGSSSLVCLSATEGSIIMGVSLVFNVILIFALLRAIYVHFRSRGGFHSFYTLFIILVLLTHLIYATAEIFTTIFRIKTDPLYMQLVLLVYTELLVYQLFMLAFCLIERTVATIYRSCYEHSYYCCIPIFAQIFAFGGMVVVYIFFKPIIVLMSLIGGHIVLIISLVLLLKKNNIITQGIVGKATLTTRYQVAENIRALRTLRPVNVLEMLIISVILGFNILESYKLVDWKCTCWIWLTRKTILFVFDMLVPFTFISSHPAYKKFMHRCIKWQWKTTATQVYHLNKNIRDKNLPKVVNVLGIDVVGQNQEYFERLEQNWMRRFVPFLGMK